MDKKISVIGMWHLGCVTAACLAKLGYQVTCLDDTKLIEDLNKGVLPIYEPGLKELMQETISKGSINFTSDFEKVIPESDIIYIAYDVRVDENDILDLAIINKAINKITPFLNKDSMIIIASQIPVGTSDRVVEQMRENGKNNNLAYIPENLKLGDGINAFLNQDRIVIGLSTQVIKQRVLDFLSGIKSKYMFMSLKSAEMAKHAMNSYLGTMISFSGEISDLCEKVGANAIDVMNSLKEEKRVSKYAPINPGLGFGGGTLARDMQVLRAIGQKMHIRTNLLNAVMEVNNNRIQYVANKLASIFGSLNDKKIAFFGLAYKAGTNTLRKSLPLQLIGQAKQTNTRISAYDPLIKNPVEDYDYIEVAKTAEEAAKGADAIVITSDWDEFKKLDYDKIAKNMRTPIILDAKNILDKTKIKGANIKYYAIGVGNDE